MPPRRSLLPKHLSHDVGLESSLDIADVQWHSPRGEHTSDSVWRVAAHCGGGAFAFWVPFADGDDGAVGVILLFVRSVRVGVCVDRVCERRGSGITTAEPEARTNHPS